ncbi:MAG: phospholipase [Actinomycetota bacterium]
MPINRRDFMKAAAGAGGALVIAQQAAKAGIVLPAPNVSLPSLLPYPEDSGIEHVVVIMMENRSTDHLLGWHPNADVVQHQTFLDNAGVAHDTHDLGTMYMGCGFDDPDHGYAGGRTHVNGGAMDGFLKTAPAGDTFPIGYYGESARPFYNSLARNFTVLDKYFCSTLTSTFPNRVFLHAAATDRLTNTFDQSTLPTIWDRIADTNGAVTGAYYFQDLPTLGLWGEKHLAISHHIERFFVDVAAGQLPNVAFLDPRALEEGNTGSSGDDHPHADLRVGEYFMQQVFQAVAQSPAWKNTVFIITYDEWGGFFDHVAPPRAADASSGLDHDLVDGKAMLGVRVPVIVASPFSKGNPADPRVNSGVYDHASILKLIEWRWGFAPLSARDASSDVANLADALDFTNPDAALPQLGTAPFVVPTPCNPVVPEGDWVDFANSGLLDAWKLPALTSR